MKFDLVDTLIDLDIEELLIKWEPEIDHLVKRLKVNRPFILKQIKLHIPLFISESERPFKHLLFPYTLKRILLTRLKNYAELNENYLKSSGGNLIGESSIIKNNQLHLDSKVVLEIAYGEVSQEIGLLIEAKLHYLKLAKSKTSMRRGLFIKGYDFPLCYMAFNPNDRFYKTFGLGKSLKAKIASDEVLQLSRVFGFGNLPRNSISWLLSNCIKEIRSKVDFTYLITAFNPFLGFTGESIKACGFMPFATCPVSYIYDNNGEYIGRRNPLLIGNIARMNTPANLLLVKGLTRQASLKINSSTEVVEIPLNLFNQEEHFTDEHLNILRLKLETAWDNLTKHHKTPRTINDPISKGQCGVTTAFLAKEFDQIGYNVLFCEGSVQFPGGISPINDHCWLKIPYLDNGYDVYRNVIIDLTSDQTGFNSTVICDTNENLIKQSIFYLPQKELPAKSITNGSLINRLQILQNRLVE